MGVTVYPEPTQPVSGTVTANAGTNLNTSALALDATLGTTNTEIGATNESAAATDTSTSGLNGLLKRIAQRLTSIIGLFPTSLGQKTMANSLAVVVASDQSALPVASHAVTNAGTFVTQENGSALTSLQLIDDTIFTDDAGFTPGTSKVSVIGLQVDETSTDSVDEGDAGAPRMTPDRKMIVTAQPHTAGGLSIFRSLDLDETEEEVKGTAGTVHGCWVTNTATSTRWLKFYNATAANVTVGSTTPVITIGIPGNSSDDISAHFGANGHGLNFDAAITVAATTGVADADTGGPAANDVICNVFYK